MEIKVLKEYKLAGFRNNKPRKPLIFEDKIYIIFVYDKKSFVESKIQCLSLDNFDLIWEYTHNHVINNIIISSEKTLIASCMNGKIISFDLDKGTELWRFETNESNIGMLSNELNGKIVFSGIQSKTTSTYCLDIQTGVLKWKQKNSGHSYIPKIFNAFVFNCIGNDLFCLNLSDGEVLWSQHEASSYMFNPTVFKDFIVSSGHGIINFHDLEKGNLIIKIDTGLRSSIYKFFFHDSYLYFANEKGIFYCYEISENRAQLKWQVDTTHTIEAEALLIDKNIFLLNHYPKLMVLNIDNGDLVCEKRTKGPSDTSGVVFYHNKIYYTCSGGYVFEAELRNKK